MAYQLEAPIVSTFVLLEIDPTGEAKVSFRQATVKECLLRDRRVYGEQKRTFSDDGLTLQNTISDLERGKIEVYLTLCGAEGLLKEDGETEIFRFREGKLAMNQDEFGAAWDRLPPSVALLIHGRCLDANPDWDFRTGGRKNQVAENSED